MIGVNNRILILILILFLSLLFLICIGCGKKKNTSKTPEVSKYELPDTLRFGTLYGPTSYFLYKGENMGYDYEMASAFAKSMNRPFKIEVAHNIDSLISLLNKNKIDLIAFEVPITGEYNNRVLHCGTENITHQVLIQPIAKNIPLITDVTQLIGKNVYVEKNTKYEFRLKNLDNELGGGINIHPISQDTLITEDLIEMVSEGKLPLTIIDSDIAKLNKTYYNNIDISLPVSFPQRASWAVKKGNKALAQIVNKWYTTSQNEATSKALLKRYFEMSKNTPGVSLDYNLTIKKGKISPYDDYFKKYASNINWDWRLLAAQGYAESGFRNDVESWAGARGIMQLMPQTAAAYGLSQSNIRNPELNIKAAAASIKDLDKSLSRYVKNKTERRKFIIAAYNAGLGHVLDAIALAKKYGKNPEKWDDNVEVAIQMKANPEYYNDEVVRCGYFKGKQTVEYVAQVEKIYDLYRHKVPNKK